MSPDIEVLDGAWKIVPPDGRDFIIDVSGAQGQIKLKGPVWIEEGALRLAGANGAEAANALLAGVGTTADPATTAVADKDFLEIRAQSTATTGTGRLAYFRFNLAGAGADGECLRVLTDLTAALTTARGTQISLQVGNTGYISGLGAAVDAQLYVKGAAVPANGTYVALNVEIYGEASADISLPTLVAFIRIVNSGDGTAKGKVDDKAFLFDLEGFTSGAAKLWYDHQGTAPTNVEEWLKIKTPSGTRWIPAYNAVV